MLTEDERAGDGQRGTLPGQQRHRVRGVTEEGHPPPAPRRHDDLRDLVVVQLLGGGQAASARGVIQPSPPYSRRSAAGMSPGSAGSAAGCTATRDPAVTQPVETH